MASAGRAGSSGCAPSSVPPASAELRAAEDALSSIVSVGRLRLPPLLEEGRGLPLEPAFDAAVVAARSQALWCSLREDLAVIAADAARRAADSSQDCSDRMARVTNAFLEANQHAMYDTQLQVDREERLQRAREAALARSMAQLAGVTGGAEVAAAYMHKYTMPAVGSTGSLAPLVVAPALKRDARAGAGPPPLPVRGGVETRSLHASASVPVLPHSVAGAPVPAAITPLASARSAAASQLARTPTVSADAPVARSVAAAVTPIDWSTDVDDATLLRHLGITNAANKPLGGRREGIAIDRWPSRLRSAHSPDGDVAVKPTASGVVTDTTSATTAAAVGSQLVSLAETLMATSAAGFGAQQGLFDATMTRLVETALQAFQHGLADLVTLAADHGEWLKRRFEHDIGEARVALTTQIRSALAAAREDVRARLGHLQRHHDADMERLHRESQDRESAALSAYARAVRGMRSLKQTNDGLRQCILAIGADVGRSAAARALLLPHSIPVDVARGVVAPASQTTSAPAHAYDSDSAGAQANAATDLLTLMTSSPRVSAAGSDGVPTRDETSSWSTDTAMSASTSSRGRRASIGPIPHHSSSSSSSSSSKSSSAGPTACLTGHATTTSSATVEPAAPCLHSRVITAARLADADESSSKVGGIVARIQELRQVEREAAELREKLAVAESRAGTWEAHAREARYLLVVKEQESRDIAVQEGRAAVSKRLADSDDHLREVRADVASARATLLQRDGALAQLRRELDKARLDIAKAHEEMEDWRRRAEAASADRLHQPTAAAGTVFEAAGADDTGARPCDPQQRQPTSALASKVKAIASAASVLKIRRRASSTDSLPAATAATTQESCDASDTAVDDTPGVTLQRNVTAQCVAVGCVDSVTTATDCSGNAAAARETGLMSETTEPIVVAAALAAPQTNDATSACGASTTRSNKADASTTSDAAAVKPTNRRRSAVDAPTAATAAGSHTSGADVILADAVAQLARTRAALEHSKAAGEALRDEHAKLLAAHCKTVADATRAQARISVMDSMITKLRRELKTTQSRHDAPAQLQRVATTAAPPRASATRHDEDHSARSADETADERGCDAGSECQGVAAAATAKIAINQSAASPIAEGHVASELPLQAAATACGPIQNDVTAVGVFAALQRRWLQQLEDSHAIDGDATTATAASPPPPIEDVVTVAGSPATASPERRALDVLRGGGASHTLLAANGDDLPNTCPGDDAAQEPGLATPPPVHSTVTAQAAFARAVAASAGELAPPSALLSTRASGQQAGATAYSPHAVPSPQRRQGSAQQPATTDDAHDTLFSTRPLGAVQAGWLVQTPTGLVFMPVSTPSSVATQPPSPANTSAVDAVSEARHRRASSSQLHVPQQERARSAQLQRTETAVAVPARRPRSAPHDACADAILRAGVIGLAGPSRDPAARDGGGDLGISVPRWSAHMPLHGVRGRCAPTHASLCFASGLRPGGSSPSTAAGWRLHAGGGEYIGGARVRPAATAATQRVQSRSRSAAKLQLASTLPAVVDRLLLLPHAGYAAHEDEAGAQARNLTASLVALHDSRLASGGSALGSAGQAGSAHSSDAGEASAPCLPSPLAACGITMMRRAGAACSVDDIADVRPEGQCRAQTSSCVHRPRFAPLPRPLSAGELTAAVPARRRSVSAAVVWPLGFQLQTATVVPSAGAAADATSTGCDVAVPPGF